MRINGVTTRVKIHHISFISGYVAHTVSRLPASSLPRDLNIFSFCWPPGHAGTSWAAKRWFNKRSSWEPLCTKPNYYEHEETFSSFLPRNSPVGRQHNFVARNVSRNAHRTNPPPPPPPPAFLFLFFSFHHPLSLYFQRQTDLHFVILFVLLLFLFLEASTSYPYFTSSRFTSSVHGIIPEECKIDQDKARWHIRWRIYSSYLVNKTNLVHNLFLVYL